MQFEAPPPPPPRPATRRAPTFQANPAADARRLLGALLPPRPTLRHVLQAHARLAVLGLATARALPHLLAALPRLPPGGDGASYSYPLALLLRSSSASAYASNHLLRVLPHPLPLRLFPRLPHRNPHSFTFLLSSLSNGLDAAGSPAAASRSLGAHVHALAVKAGAAGDLYVRNALVHFYGVCGDLAAMRRVFDELPRVRDVVTWNAVLAGYVRAGRVGDAREVFDGMPVRDEVSWSTVVGGYVKGGELEVALGVFRDMAVQGVKVNEAAVVTALSAAAQLGLLEQGRFVHEVVQKIGMPVSVNVGAALVDMYSKCGSVAAAREVFDAMPRRDVFAWNAMICGLAAHGLGRDAVELFERFVSQGLCPTNVTFVGVLNACSRSGLVDEGRRYFKLMAEKYGVEPEMEHYGCMVDLLGRAGLVQEAIELIEEMRMAPDPVLWGTILSACKTHGLVDLGVTVGNKLIELEPAHDGHYVLLASIYARAKKWEEVRKVRKLMSSRGTSKSAGWSLMEARGNVHKFLVGDMDHKDSVQIYNTLDMIDRRLVEAGYVPDVSSVLHDIGDEEKEHAIKVHSERLAIAYGFIVVEAGSPIRIVKNLRVCGDCHEFSKMVTKVFEREIIVRDGSRFHHMKEGKCSCLDYCGGGTDEPMLFDGGGERAEADRFLRAVNDLCRLAPSSPVAVGSPRRFSSSSRSSAGGTGSGAVQVAMARFEDEFRHVLFSRALSIEIEGLANLSLLSINSERFNLASSANLLPADEDDFWSMPWSELHADYCRTPGMRIHLPSAASLLPSSADIDNSGSTDYGEFFAATLHLNKVEEDNFFAAFSYFNKDGSCYITQDGPQKACEKFNMQDAHLEDIIPDINQDHPIGNGCRTTILHFSINLGRIVSATTSADIYRIATAGEIV
ncbi:hypothetical protein ACP70R_014447 [Stipagrostis hirtigluma subsp. patula]